jgi:heat-inducible transcriptional repressor
LSFAIAPAGETATLEHVDFVPLDGGKILVVVVSTGGHVSHKVIEPVEPHNYTELQQAANYLNREFKGQTLQAVRAAVVQRLREERSLYDELMGRALRLANSTFADMASEPVVFIQGTSLLLEDIGSESPDETLETLRTLLRMIEEKARLVQLLDDYLSGGGLTVVIGSEHHSPALQRFSLIASTYTDGYGTGAVGVIGPTRMRYSRVINAVEGLSKAISRTVTSRS